MNSMATSFTCSCVLHSICHLHHLHIKELPPLQSTQTSNSLKSFFSRFPLAYSSSSIHRLSNNKNVKRLNHIRAESKFDENKYSDSTDSTENLTPQEDVKQNELSNKVDDVLSEKKKVVVDPIDSWLPVSNKFGGWSNIPDIKKIFLEDQSQGGLKKIAIGLLVTLVLAFSGFLFYSRKGKSTMQLSPPTTTTTTTTTSELNSSKPAEKKLDEKNQKETNPTSPIFESDAKKSQNDKVSSPQKIDKPQKMDPLPVKSTTDTESNDTVQTSSSSLSSLSSKPIILSRQIDDDKVTAYDKDDESLTVSIQTFTETTKLHIEEDAPISIEKDESNTDSNRKSPENLNASPAESIKHPTAGDKSPENIKSSTEISTSSSAGSSDESSSASIKQSGDSINPSSDSLGDIIAKTFTKSTDPTSIQPEISEPKPEPISEVSAKVQASSQASSETKSTEPLSAVSQKLPESFISKIQTMEPVGLSNAENEFKEVKQLENNQPVVISIDVGEIDIINTVEVLKIEVVEKNEPPEPIAEPVKENITELIAEVITKPISEPVSEPTTEPVSETVPETRTRSFTEDILGPVQLKPVTPKAVTEPVPVKLVSPETKSKPVTEATPEPVTEATPEPVTEATPEPVQVKHVPRMGKILVPAVIDPSHAQAYSTLQTLKIIENDLDVADICKRREYARWLLSASNVLSRSTSQRIFPSMYMDEHTEIAFDDVLPSDPDFSFIQGLAEAGLIPSKLSQNDIHSSSSSSETMSTESLFNPDSPLTRQDLICWKAAMDYRTLPSVTASDVRKLSGFIDSDRISKQSLPSIYADLKEGENSIISSTFGYTRRFEPFKPVTRAQAAFSLAVGNASEVIAEEIARLEAQLIAELAIKAAAEEEAEVLRSKQAVADMALEELQREKEKRKYAELALQEALTRLEKTKRAYLNEKKAVEDSKLAVVEEQQKLESTREETEKTMSLLFLTKEAMVDEKKKLEKLMADMQVAKSEVNSAKEEVDKQMEVLSRARSFASAEAKKAEEEGQRLLKLRRDMHFLQAKDEKNESVKAALESLPEKFELKPSLRVPWEQGGSDRTKNLIPGVDMGKLFRNVSVPEPVDGLLKETKKTVGGLVNTGMQEGKKMKEGLEKAVDEVGVSVKVAGENAFQVAKTAEDNLKGAGENLRKATKTAEDNLKGAGENLRKAAKTAEENLKALEKQMAGAVENVKPTVYKSRAVVMDAVKRLGHGCQEGVEKINGIINKPNSSV